MSTRRFKSATMKFGVPLSVPGSRYVERCYGKHGKGYARTPPRYSAIELILINQDRQLWSVPGRHQETHEYVTTAVGVHEGWRILGWRMADGMMPLGGYDEIDPELAQFEYLPQPNPPPFLQWHFGQPAPEAGVKPPA